MIRPSRCRFETTTAFASPRAPFLLFPFLRAIAAPSGRRRTIVNLTSNLRCQPICLEAVLYRHCVFKLQPHRHGCPFTISALQPTALGTPDGRSLCLQFDPAGGTACESPVLPYAVIILTRSSSPAVTRTSLCKRTRWSKRYIKYLCAPGYSAGQCNLQE